MSGTNYIASNWRLPENSNSSKNDNYSLSFDGNEYITINSSTQLDETPLNPYSISFWIKTTNSSSSRVISEKRATSTFTDAQYTVHLQSGSVYWYGGAGGTGSPLFTSSPINDGEWHHIVLVAESITSSKMYVDGQLDGTSSGNRINSSSIAGTFNIGSNYTGSFIFIGDLSEYSIFDYALTLDQVNTLYGDATSGSGNPMALKPTPVAYYPLGDNSASNPLTQPNVSVDDASVFDFDFSSSQYIDAGNPTSLQITGALTISTWVKMSSTSGGTQDCIISKDNGSSQRSYTIWGKTTSSSSPIAYIWNGGTNYSVQATTNIEDDNWHHVMLVYVPSTSLNIYIDGVLEGSNTTSIPSSINNANQNFNIGRLGNATFYYTGQISNVVLWSSDQSSEISNIYNSGVPATSYTNTPVAWYKLDQSANWEADTSGNWQVPDAVSAYPQSFDFDGSNDIIDCGYFPEFSGATKSSFSFWLNRTTTSPNHIFGINVSSFNRIGCTIVNDTINFYIGGINGFITSFITTNGWYHIAIVYDYSEPVNADRIKIYLNGVPTSCGNVVSSSFPALNANLKLGTFTTQYLTGGLSNFSIFPNIALTQDNVNDIYNSGTPATSYTNTPAAWYKLDNTELFDNTNWSVENQVYPSNYNSALSFNTSESDYIQLPLSTFVYPGEFALSVWVNPTILSNDQVIFGNGSGSDNWLRLSSATQITFKIDTNSQNFNEGSGNDLVVDTWQHLLITRDSSNDVKIYRNGVIFGAATNYTQTLTISSIGYRGSFYYDGEMSNIVVWNSDQGSEKDNIYNNGTPTNSYTNIPTSWWKLDNLTTGLQDSGSGGNNATNNGTTVANTFVNTESATSSGMTEQSLVNNNVSTLNGESSGMTSGSLVLSDLTRNLPYENYSLNFDAGSSEDIDLGLISELNNTSTYTLSMWVNPSVLSGLQYLFALVTSGTERLYIYLNNAIPNVGMANGTNTNESFNSAPLTIDTWHHLAVVFDGTQTGADRLTFYLNGVAETTTATTWDSTTPTFVTNAFLSNYAQFGLYYFSGKIGNFSIFSDALSTTEVLKLYANGLPQDLTNFTPQPAHWWTLGKESFWNGSDWIVRDMIGSNDGTSANMAVSDLVGDAPRSEANGTGTNMDIPTNLVGNAGFSDKNAYSINMSPSARVTDTP